MYPQKNRGGNKLLTQLELISSFTISVGQTMSVPLTQKYSAYLFRMLADDMDNLVWINPNSPTSTISSGTVVDSNLADSNLKWIHLVGGCVNGRTNVGESFTMLPYDVRGSFRYSFMVYSNSKGLVVDYETITVNMYHFTVQYVLK